MIRSCAASARGRPPPCRACRGFAVELEDRIAADHRGTLGFGECGDGFSLCPGRAAPCHVRPSRRSAPAPRPRPRPRPDIVLDSRFLQQLGAGRGLRGKDQSGHRPSLVRRSLTSCRFGAVPLSVPAGLGRLLYHIAYAGRMLLLVDLDNTLVDRTSAFACWATNFVRSLGRPDSDAAWLITADRDGYEPRDPWLLLSRSVLAWTVGSKPWWTSCSSNMWH